MASSAKKAQSSRNALKQTTKKFVFKARKTGATNVR
jgi:hypothetical protein